jgi:hypothetical protein
MLAFTPIEKKLLQKINTPAKVQDFLNTIPFNFERNGKDRVKSPIRVLRERNAHCIEGAIFAAYVLSLHGYKPLLIHLESTKKDYDHVVTLFQEDGLWGAISQTNHAVLRYREPVYETIRELALSYFHEYFLHDGTKTLRRYSEPLNLDIFESNWTVEENDLWGIDEELDLIAHFDIVPKKLVRKLRKADPIERKVGKIVEWKK